jgi:hypothetical protein
MERDDPAVTMDHFHESIRSFDVNTDERTQNIKAMVDRLKRLEQVNQRFLDTALSAYAKKEEAVDVRVKGLLEAMQPPPGLKGAVSV